MWFADTVAAAVRSSQGTGHYFSDVVLLGGCVDVLRSGIPGVVV